MTSAVEFRGVSRHFGSVRAVDSVDLAVAEGQQDKHVQQMWLYDAIQIEFINKEHVFGLFTMGLNNFEIENIND